MCTVTVLRAPEPNSDLIRLVENRDESPLRPPALPPEVFRCGTRAAIWPVDPTSGGTWIGVNDAGLCGTLLNYYPQPHQRGGPAPKRSRGTILPALLHGHDWDAVQAAIADLEPTDFAPFRLVFACRHSVAEYRCDGHTLDFAGTLPLDEPRLFTSSGLGDEVVEAPRRALFDEFFRDRTDLVATQDRFHRHQWPDRPEISVCMRRPTAQTVSLTRIEITSQEVRLTYHAAPPDVPAAATTLRLPRR